MNDVKVFSFYRNYYELIKHLPTKNRVELYDAILKYMFEDEEPKLTGLNQGIWVNLKMVLDNNKKNINNGKKGGRPKRENKNPKETQTETQIKTQKKPNKEPKQKANNIYFLLFIISNFKYNNIYINNNIYNKIYEWLEYKEQRKEKYTEIGLKKLLTQIDNKIDEYGEQAVCSLIDECMANNYKGIIFEKLQKNKKESTSERIDRLIKEAELEEQNDKSRNN